VAKIGRPRTERAASARIVQIKLRLYPGEDDDLMAFFDVIPERLRAVMVKRSLRSGIQGEENSDMDGDDEMLDILDELIF